MTVVTVNFMLHSFGVGLITEGMVSSEPSGPIDVAGTDDFSTCILLYTSRLLSWPWGDCPFSLRCC